MFINLTGHEIYELTSGIRIQPSGIIRTSCYTTQVATIEGIPVSRTVVTIPVTELPPRAEGITYIVSALTLNSIPDDRTDIVAPKKVIRDDSGTIIGCKEFRCK